MNLTKQQILALPLEDKQKLVVELNEVPISDPGFANAKAVLDLIGVDKTYKKPELVKATAENDIQVDGREVKAGQTVDLYPWQYRALARFFKLAGKAAAALLLGLLVLSSAWAQTTGNLTGQYGPVSIASLNGGTNNQAANSTNLYWAPVITTNTLNAAVVTVSNGVTYFTTNTSYTYTTNIPGRLNATKFRDIGVQVNYAHSGGSGTNATYWAFYQGLDGSTNVWPAFTLITTNIATANTITVGTNYTLGAPGYLFLWSAGNAGTNGLTNVQVQAVGKPTITY